MTDAARAVVLSGGYAHPFAETSAVVAALAAEAGLVVTVIAGLPLVLKGQLP